MRFLYLPHTFSRSSRNLALVLKLRLRRQPMMSDTNTLRSPFQCSPFASFEFSMHLLAHYVVYFFCTSRVSHDQRVYKRTKLTANGINCIWTEKQSPIHSKYKYPLLRILTAKKSGKSWIFPFAINVILNRSNKAFLSNPLLSVTPRWTISFPGSLSRAREGGKMREILETKALLKNLETSSSSEHGYDWLNDYLKTWKFKVSVFYTSPLLKIYIQFCKPQTTVLCLKHFYCIAYFSYFLPYKQVYVHLFRKCIRQFFAYDIDAKYVVVFWVFAFLENNKDRNLMKSRQRFQKAVVKVGFSESRVKCFSWECHATTWGEGTGNETERIEWFQVVLQVLYYEVSFWYVPNNWVVNCNEKKRTQHIIQCLQIPPGIIFLQMAVNY